MQADLSRGAIRRRVALIVASQGVHRALTLIVPLAITPLALRKLGTEAYGAWMLAASLGAYLSFSLGIPSALVDVTARGLADGDHVRVGTYFRHGVAALCVIAVAVLSVTPFVAWKVSVGVPDSRLLVLASLVLAAVALPFSAVRAVAEGLQEVHRLNLASSVSVLVSAILTFVGLSSWPSVYWLYFLAGAPIVGQALVARGMLRRHQWLEDSTGWSWLVLRELAKSGGWFTVVGLAWLVIYGTDIWVIKLTVGLHEVTPYGLVFTLFSALAEPLATLVMSLRPLAARFGTAGARALLRKSVRLGVVAGLLINGLGLLWHRVIMDFWVGPAVHTGIMVALILAGFQVARSFLNASAWVLVPIEGPRRLAMALVGDALLNLTFSLWLGRLVGPWGVAAGSLLAIVACSGWYIPRHAKRLLGVPLLGRWALLALLAAAPLWLAGAMLQPNRSSFGGGMSGLLELASAATATVALAGFVVLYVGLEPDERDRVRWYARRMLASVASPRWRKRPN